MKKPIFLLTALALVIQAPGALAAIKYDSRKMTCRDVTELVDQKQEVVIRYDDFLYATFFRYNNFCDGRPAALAYLPTKDNSQCFVGFSCTVGGMHVARKTGGGGVTVIGASVPVEHQHR